jgi:hypothetical protein
MTQGNATEVKRGRGRPASFPGQETRVAGFNLPIETLDMLAAEAETRGVTQNAVVAKAIERLVADSERKRQG